MLFNKWYYEYNNFFNKKTILVEKELSAGKLAR